MSQPKISLSQLLAPRGFLPALLMAGGVVIAALALALDWIGVPGTPGLGPGQLRVALAGALLTLLGAALDAALGTGHLRSWYRRHFPERSVLLRFFAIAAQLALLVLVMHAYQIENRAFFHNILLLALLGFFIHHFLPAGWRLPFFLLLSVGGISGVLGAVNAAWLIGAGLVLVAVCHLPVRFGVRVALLLAVACAMAAMRADWLRTPFPSVLWPVLGSMFMFRLIVFLYDLKHQKDRAPWPQTLSYFFLLPNVVFPLFPVVDYKTFRRTYYDAPWPDIYQRGIHWMFRGLTHLLLYRLLNYYVMLSPEEVASAGDLLRFLVANFLLYLRVSGQFHLIIGLLHLFGFHLPETNHLYCFSSSFTDFWRRINIYWKDFMMKVFYYPAYFALQKRGATLALMVATVWVFVATWLLHAYQWFWLRGTFLLSATDVLFWTILGALMVGNTLLEAKFGRKRTLVKASLTAKDFALRGLRTAGTFASIVTLWSLWTSSSIADWLALFSFSGATTPVASGLTPSSASLWCLVAAMALASDSGPSARRLERWTRSLRSPLAVSLLLLALYVAGSPLAYTRLHGFPQDLMATLRAPRDSQRETALRRRGYYEGLHAGAGGRLFQDLLTRRPDGWTSLIQTEAARFTGDYMGQEHVPNTSIIFRGARYSINRWGMRDKDYELTPPPSTYRVAVLGASQVVGQGVADNESFEALLEERFNRERGEHHSLNYELLNFAYGGYSPIQQVLVLENKALRFAPNALLYFGGSVDPEWSVNFLGAKFADEIEPPYEFLRTLMRRAQVELGGPKVAIQQRLTPFSREIVAWAYAHIVSVCREQNILPIYIQIPNEPGVEESSEDLRALRRIAAEAGFLVVDATGTFDGMDPKALQVAEWDRHPNRRGHQLLAEAIYEALRKLDFPPTPSSSATAARP